MNSMLEHGSFKVINNILFNNPVISFSFLRFQDLVGSISAPILDNVDGDDVLVDQDALEVSRSLRRLRDLRV